jgi:hypothetical protein
VLNKQKITNPKSAEIKAKNPSAACTTEELKAYIEAKMLECLNHTDIAQKLKSCGYSPKDLTFSFKLNTCSGKVPQASYERKYCPGCVCTCWDDELQLWVNCPCSF